MSNQKITPCLWFDTEAEEAAIFYTAIFKNAKIGTVSRYSDAAAKQLNRPQGLALVVMFELNGQEFMALNGGPQYKFNESTSFHIGCNTQEEIDHYWNSLTADGGQEGRCVWLKDKFGLSWQVVPNELSKLMSDPSRSGRVMPAFMKMNKLDIETLRNA